ncbi:MAG: tetratricopeptide repeat protein [Pseudomonadota bacterium]
MTMVHRSQARGLCSAVALALVLCVASAAFFCANAFDGTPSATQPAEMTPGNAVKLGTKAYREGNIREAVDRWTAAAEAGHAVAQWRLARMFADGKGVPRDDAKAFHWFKMIVDNHAEDEPGTMQGQIAGRAFTQLGAYYREGIGGELKSDMPMAWRMYYQAASIFGDTEAQYQLGNMYLEGEGVEKNAQLAANWLRNAAEKGHARAQAALGNLMFANSEDAPRRRVEGLMWLSLARNQAKKNDDAWIVSSFEDAYTLASDEERMNAANNVKRWQKQP